MSCKGFCYAAAVSSCLLDDPSMIQKYNRENKNFSKSDITLFRSSLPTPFLKFLICLLHLCASSFSIHINEGTASWVAHWSVTARERLLEKKHCGQGKTPGEDQKDFTFSSTARFWQGFTGTHRFGYSWLIGSFMRCTNVGPQLELSYIPSYSGYQNKTTSLSVTVWKIPKEVGFSAGKNV